MFWHMTFYSENDYNSGFVGVAFSMGSLSVWFPQFLALSYVNRGELDPCVSDDCEYSGVMFIFGVFTSIAGILGVGIGLFGSANWKKDKGPREYPILKNYKSFWKLGSIDHQGIFCRDVTHIRNIPLLNQSHSIERCKIYINENFLLLRMINKNVSEHIFDFK